MPENPGDTLMTMEELADYFGISPPTLRVRRHRGWAPPMKWVEGRLYISRADLIAWVAIHGRDLKSIKQHLAIETYRRI